MVIQEAKLLKICRIINKRVDIVVISWLILLRVTLRKTIEGAVTHILVYVNL